MRERSVLRELDDHLEPIADQKYFPIFADDIVMLTLKQFSFGIFIYLQQFAPITQLPRHVTDWISTFNTLQYVRFSSCWADV